MKYYYIDEYVFRDRNIFNTSRLNVDVENNEFDFYSQSFWDCTKPIQLIIQAQEGETFFVFDKYKEFSSNNTYSIGMIPEIKTVFEQFNMPEHRWYEAEVGYDLNYIKKMERFSLIRYNNIDINEKRPYWVLQITDTKCEEWKLSNMKFNIVEFQNKKLILEEFNGTIRTTKEYYDLNREVYLESKKTDITKYIHPSTYAYQKNYDILWAGIHIVFNEKVKEALEATHIITAENGLEFVEFTDYEIEMLGE